MKTNIKVAQELVKLAKSLVGEEKKVTEEAQQEIDTLKKAMAEGGYALLNHGTLTRRLEKSGFPYTLVQTYDKGKVGNLYRWTGTWGKGSIYVQETIAGRPVTGIRKACENLIKAIQQAAWA